MAAAPGNQYAAKAKQWQMAIERALEARGASDRRAALDELAGKLLDKCAEGDMSALKELGDRLDGKPNQSIDATIGGTLTTFLAGLGTGSSKGNDPPVA